MNRTVGMLAGSVLAGVMTAAAAMAAGAGEWRDLLSDGDLSAWDNGAGGPPGAGWVIEDGAVVRKGRGGYLWTKDRFGNFILDLEFKTEGNSGIFIRTDNPRNCVQTGIEIQIYRPVDHPTRHSCGAIYDCLAPSTEASRAGQWNHITITAKDNRITVEMNGQRICDMDLNRWTEPHKNPDGSRNKFNRPLKDFRREGHIGLQDHGAWVAYRNIRVKVLD